MIHRLTLALTLALITGIPLTAEELQSVPLGTQIADFEFKDTDDNRHSLKEELKSAKAIVFAFVGTECPLVNQYMPILAKLSADYKSKDVQFVAIYSNSQDSLDEVTEHSREAQLGFPAVKDFDNRLADLFGAQRTPESVLLDGNGKIRYRGRIDDQYGYLPSGQTYIRPAATREDLKIAIDELLAKKKISEPETRILGCLIGRVAKVTDTSVTYVEHVAPIIQNHCLECHRPGQIGPFRLTRFEDVQGWGPMIKEVVQERRMPPWHADERYGHFSNDRALSREQIQTIARWVDNGMPRGEGEEPNAKQFSKGWNIGEPDMILEMPDEIKIPATGVLRYKWVTIDPKLEKDVWVRAVEMKPGDRSVVHHILMFVLLPGQSRLDDVQTSGYFAAYAPGINARSWAEGLCKKIPAGSKIILQMHYTTNGTATTDRSRIGLKFSDQPTPQLIHTLGISPPMKHFVKVDKTLPDVYLPAGEADILLKARHTLTQDVELLALMPHTHLRGKAFRYEAHYPDGRKEIILNVPRYDFNWQTAYELEKPLALPKGSSIYCEAIYDNSSQNPNNPDPTVDIYWGPQTWDEMMIGYFDYIPSVEKRETPGGREGQKQLRSLLIGVFLLYDKNRDAKLARDELPDRRLKRGFDAILPRLDKNGDGMIGRDEIPSD